MNFYPTLMLQKFSFLLFQDAASEGKPYKVLGFKLWLMSLCKNAK